MKEKQFRQTFDCVTDILKDNSDAYIVLAVNSEDGGVAVSADDGDEYLSIAISSSMDRSAEFRNVIFKSVAEYAKNHGNVRSIDVPTDATLN